jgi:hypothetical protein
MIPSVKQWLVTTERGKRFIVLAPTRLLARMNFRHMIGWDPIRKIGIVRKNRLPPSGGLQPIAWEDK